MSTVAVSKILVSYGLSGLRIVEEVIEDLLIFLLSKNVMRGLSRTLTI